VTSKVKCHYKSNSFVAAAEQLCSPECYVKPWVCTSCKSALYEWLCAGRGSTSVRIELLETGRFRLDGERPGAHLLPSSPCVLDLLRRHTAAAADGEVGRAEVVLLDGGRETPLVLRRPLYRNAAAAAAAPASLKHLCRRRIHSVLDGRNVDRLHLVPSLKQYLKDYPCDL